MRLYRSFASAPGFDRLEITPQFSAMLSDLIASLATIDRCEQRICKLAPRDPQQFLQSVHGTEQFVWRCHPPVAFEIDEGNVLRRIILIRTIGETLGPTIAFAGLSLKPQHQHQQPPRESL
jgi:hypothetical protein